jgi:YfiH family protein
VNFIPTSYGLEYQTDQVQVFFGNQNAKIEQISEVFPQLKFSRINQTHSDMIIEASEKLVEADAHFTFNKGRALLIATADCLPVLIWDPQLNLVASVHAGWKGVANRIVPKTLLTLKTKGSSLSQLKIFIGPHIQESSFEVDEDVKVQLEKSISDLFKVGSYCSQKMIDEKSKFYINLNSILFQQITEVGCKEPDVFETGIDTKRDISWHSYRRDHKNSGRNLSFIALKA